MRRIAAIGMALALTAPAAFAQGQPVPPLGPDFSKVEVKTFDLGGNTYMLEGAGGNVTIAVGRDGIIMVDGQFSPMHGKLKAAIEAVSRLPIRYLINTHYHGDHTGGNAVFGQDGVAVVSHVNVRNRLAAGFTNGLTGAKTPAAPDAALPRLTYTDTLVVRVDGRAALLRHPANAHTDGDTFVYYEDANVLATGDTVTIGRYPNIDFANGGNIAGMIATAETYLSLSDDRTKIVPGHGPLADKAALRAYRDMLVTARDRIARLVSEGKSEHETLAAAPLADLDASWAPSPQAATNFVRVVYNSLKPK